MCAADDDRASVAVPTTAVAGRPRRQKADDDANAELQVAAAVGSLAPLPTFEEWRRQHVAMDGRWLQPALFGQRQRQRAGRTDGRYNFVAAECGAKVLATNAEAVNAGAVLSEDRDRYMLNPCDAPHKFVVLEMCDTVLVDTIVLGNLELFSSSPRRVRVALSASYPTDAWKPILDVEAADRRALQTFAVPEPAPWARYIRIDLDSYHGAKFYCPLTVVRVHGATMMQDYQEDLHHLVDAPASASNGATTASSAAAATPAGTGADRSNLATLGTAPPAQVRAPDASTDEPAPCPPWSWCHVRETVLGWTHQLWHGGAPNATPSSNAGAGGAPSTASARARDGRTLVFRYDDDGADETAVPPPTAASQSSHAKGTGHGRGGPRRRPAAEALYDNRTVTSAHYNVFQDTAASTRQRMNALLMRCPASDKAREMPPTWLADDDDDDDDDALDMGASGWVGRRPVTPGASIDDEAMAPMLVNLPPLGGESFYKAIAVRLLSLEVNATLAARYMDAQIARIYAGRERRTDPVPPRRVQARPAYFVCQRAFELAGGASNIRRLD